jgi:DNA-binding NarL/FixJ family response regulator
VSITVVTADDQPLMRAALRMYLSTAPDIEVVGEATDGLEAVELAERLRPDVVVMDLRMPRLDGIEATRRLVAEQIRVLAITTFDVDEYMVDALRAGASGFLLKDTTCEELLRAVRVIAAGDALLAPHVTRRLLDRYAHRLPPPGPSHTDRLGRLTPREVEVLALVARGLSNTEIARGLHLAGSSVKTHVGHLLSKVGVADRVQLVVFAYESGLVQPGTL